MQLPTKDKMIQAEDLYMSNKYMNIIVGENLKFQRFRAKPVRVACKLLYFTRYLIKWSGEFEHEQCIDVIK